MTRSFGHDVEFLRRYVDVFLLGRAGVDARVAVVPAWQGRVMTSSLAGDDGPSFGWINDELIESGELRNHINPFGGEDRLWIGPEGGQFAVFFRAGDPFDLDHWQTPAVIDTVPYQITSHSAESLAFSHPTRLTNYSGTRFDFLIERAISLLEPQAISSQLGIDTSASVGVGFESRNTITNTGANAWSKERGLLSIWILGMFRHSPRTTVVIPFRAGPINELGPIVNDAYFGKVPPDRLVVGDGVLFFSGDGAQRGKIGLTPRRATATFGSYDADRRVLTIVRYNRPPAEVADYVNSVWEIQAQPYAGDVINSYNDGPPAPGVRPLGPFYELETSSPAMELTPGGQLAHTHQTFHFQGDPVELDRIARGVLGVSLRAIEHAL